MNEILKMELRDSEIQNTFWPPNPKLWFESLYPLKQPPENRYSDHNKKR